MTATSMIVDCEEVIAPVPDGRDEHVVNGIKAAAAMQHAATSTSFLPREAMSFAHRLPIKTYRKKEEYMLNERKHVALVYPQHEPPVPFFFAYPATGHVPQAPAALLLLHDDRLLGAVLFTRGTLGAQVGPRYRVFPAF